MNAHAGGGGSVCLRLSKIEVCGCVTDTVLAQSPRPGAGVTAASLPRERPLPPLPVSLTLCHNPEPSPGEAWSSSLWKLPQQPCCGHQSNTCPIFTEDPVIKKFLAWDKNLKVSDKVRCIPAPICRVAGESFLNTQKTQFYSLSDRKPGHHFPWWGGPRGFSGSPASVRLLWDLSSRPAPLVVGTSYPLSSQLSGIPLCSSLSKMLSSHQSLPS